MTTPNFFEQAVSDCQNALDASGKFLDDTFKHPERRARQAMAVAEGLTVGGIKTVPDQFINQPEETAKQITTGIAIGAAIALAPVEIPVVATSLAVAGTAMTCAYVWDAGQRLGQNKELHKALDTVWKTGDATALKKTTPAIESALGIESFNLGLGALTAGSGMKLGSGIKQLPKLYGARLEPCLENPSTGGGSYSTLSNREIPSITTRIEPYYAMSAREPAAPSWSGKTAKIDSFVDKLKGKAPAELVEHKTQLCGAADDLLQISKSSEMISGETAEALLNTNKGFNELLKPVREDIRANSKAYEQDLLSEGEVELFDSKLDLLTAIIQKRMHALGFEQPVSKGLSQDVFSKRAGIHAQTRVTDNISKVVNPENLRPENAEIQHTFRNALGAERRLDWRGTPTAPCSPADLVGADYIIANKSSGELYAIDVTLQTGGMRTGALVDSQGLNRNIYWTKDQAIPQERSNWVIGTVNDSAYYNALRGDDFAGLMINEQLQVAKVLGNMVAKESPLNILDSHLPIGSPSQHSTMKLFELLRFCRNLEDKNMTKWPQAVRKAMADTWNREQSAIPYSWKSKF